MPNFFTLNGNTLIDTGMSTGGVQPLLSSTNKLLVADNTTGAVTEVTGSIGAYTRNVSTSTSSFTIYVTNDGTSTGSTLFQDLTNCLISIDCLRNTTSNNEAPWAYIKSITSNSVTFQVKKSNTGGILVGGTYDGNLDNTNAITAKILIFGKMN